MKYKVISVGQDLNHDGFFRVNILDQGSSDITYYEIIEYLQEINLELYQHLINKYVIDYIAMINEMIDFKIDIRSIIEEYINNVVHFRLERSKKF